MSFITLEKDRDIAYETVEQRTSYEITSLTAAQNKSINAFVAEATSTAFLTDAQSNATSIPLSSAFRHISNYYFSSTASNSIPVSHQQTSTTSLLRSIQIGRTVTDDTLLSV